MKHVVRDGALRILHKLQAIGYRPVLKPPPQPSPKGRELCLM